MVPQSPSPSAPSAGSVAPALDGVVDLHALGARLSLDLRRVPVDLAAAFRTVWQHCLDPLAGGVGPEEEVDAGSFVVADRVGESLLAGDEDAPARILMRATQSITKALIAAQAGRVLMLHAGALCDPVTGASVVYVAPGGTGKTTLSRTFGLTLGYLTDETVAITEDRRILPYRKPLSVRRDPHRGLKDELPAVSLGLLAPPRRPWVAGVLVLRRDPEMHEARVEPMDPLDAIVTLAPETSSLPLLPRPLRRLAELGEATGGFRLARYAEAVDLEPVIRDITGRVR
ncbi:hypothetical protein IDVR_35200 [Intrasporangium sp. DVR]